MGVIQFPRPAGPASPTGTCQGPLEAQLHGTLRTPRARAGTMTGRLRLERFDVVNGRLYAIVVISGELRETDDTAIGIGSRRRAVPARVTRDGHGASVVVGPLDVDLMGLTVSLPAVELPLLRSGHGWQAADCIALR